MALKRVLLPLAFLLCLPLCLRPFSDPDLPWHLAAGRWIAEHRAVPRTDFLSWTKAGEPWIDFEWGAQLAFHGLDRCGGARALWLFKSAGFALLLALLMLLLRRWGLGRAWTAAALPAVALGLAPYLNVRPELFSLFFCLAQLALLEELREGRLAASPGLLAAQFLLYALWANLHAAFPLGLALGLLWTLEGGRAGRAAAALALAGLAGTLLNPYGWRLYEVFFEHARQLGLLSQNIAEWGAIPMGALAMAPYWVLLAFCFACGLLAIWQGAALPRAHLAALLVLGWFGSSHFRHSIYVPLLLTPLALKTCLLLRPPPAGKLLAAALAAALAGMAAYGGWWTWTASAGLRLAALPSSNPDEAAAFLRREKPVLGGLRLYNSYNWGGFLGHALYPDYRVFMDGRYLFADMLAEPPPQAGRAAWQRLEERYGMDMALLEIERPLFQARRGQLAPWRPFEVFAMPRRDWALVYWDDLAMVLVRRSSVPSDWLAAHEYRHLRPGDLQVLGRRVSARLVTFREVEGEIARFRRQGNSPRELRRLEIWRAELRKELGLRR